MFYVVSICGNGVVEAAFRELSFGQQAGIKVHAHSLENQKCLINSVLTTSIHSLAIRIVSILP